MKTICLKKSERMQSMGHADVLTMAAPTLQTATDFLLFHPPNGMNLGMGRPICNN